MASKKRRGPNDPDNWEKKKRKKELRSKSRVYLGSAHEDWVKLREQMNFTTNEDLARLLIDRYKSSQQKGNNSRYQEETMIMQMEQDESSESIASTSAEHVNKAHLFTDEEIDTLIGDKVYLVYMSELKKLLSALEGNCHEEGCSELTQSHDYTEGTSLQVKWVCSNDHVNRTWCSQPVFHQEPPGDFMTSVSMICSGISFNKMSSFARLMNLQFVSPTCFNQVKRTYSVPSMETLVQMTPSETVFESSVT